MKLRNSPRFWIMLVSGVSMTIIIEWVAVLELTNSLHSYPTFALMASSILLLIFLACGWPRPTKK